MKMIELLRAVFPLRMAPVSEDADRANAILCKELPFEVHEYRSGMEHNGWTVPESWKPKKATIKKDGKTIYDGMKHVLGVVSYSTSFKGTVSLDQLKEHLFYHPTLPDCLVYHCDYFYKQWKKDWGLSVPRTLFDSLTPGDYEIDIETEFKPGAMKVLDYLLPGTSNDTIIFNAHNCHPGQANDDIAGVVVGIEVMRRLKARATRRYSYRLVVAPEHLGTVFYLAGLSPDTTKTFRYAAFLEMLGNKHRLALQESFTGQSEIDLAAHHHLKFHAPDYYGDTFRKIVGNDETVWEGPGFEIPCISLSRAFYPEYHSSNDTDAIIDEGMLNEAVERVLGIVDILETNTTMTRKFEGLLALSHPKYDLYISPGDPSIRTTVAADAKNWNHLMNCVIRYFDGKTTILDIARKHDIEYTALLQYLVKFAEKGLISFDA